MSDQPTLFDANLPNDDANLPNAKCETGKQASSKLLASVFDPAPGAARRDDWPTSMKAAVAVTGRTGSQRYKLALAYLQVGEDGATDDHAALLAGLRDRTGCCWWKRCGELRDAGVIEVTGEMRPGYVGDERIVCRITSYGRHLLGLIERQAS